MDEQFPTQPEVPEMPPQRPAYYAPASQEARDPLMPPVPAAHVPASAAYDGTLQPPQMPAPVAPTAIPAGQRIKVHHSYIWLAAVSAFIPLAIGLGFGMAIPALNLVVKGGDSTALGVSLLVGSVVLFVLIIGLIVGIQALSYHFMWYQFDQKEFSLYSGIIVKKKVHVPYSRVQSVNHTASLLQRIVGVCSVAIDTAGGASNKAVRVPYVTNAAAEQIRVELFTRKAGASASAVAPAPTSAAAMAVPVAAASDVSANAAAPAASGASANVAAAATAASGAAAPGTPGAPMAPSQAGAPPIPATAPNALDQVAGAAGTLRGVFGGQEVDTGAVTYSFGLSNKELFLTGLSNSTGVGAIIIAAAFALLGTVGGSWIGSAIQNTLGSAAPSKVASDLAVVLTNTLWALAGLMVLVAVVAWVAGIISTCIGYGSFQAVRRGSRIEVQRGLIQREFSGLDIDRVQSVVIKQTLIRRLMGYCEVSLGRIDAGAEGGQNNQNQAKLNAQGLVVHPFVKKDRVPQIVAGLIPEFADFPATLQPLPRVALRRGIVRGTIWRSGWCLALVLLAIALLGVNSIDGSRTLLDMDGLLAGAKATLGTFMVLCLAGMALQAVRAVLWQRDSGFAVNRRFMTIRNSGFSTEQISFPRTKIQFGFTRRNPFQAYAHVATIVAVTASGVGGTATRLWDVDEKEAAAWLDWLKPGGDTLQ